MASLTTPRLLTIVRPLPDREQPVFQDGERRWLWVTDLPFLVCALAVLHWLPAYRELNPLLCLALVAGYALASRVQIPLPGDSSAPCVQLAFVPMLFLAPLNAVPLLVLAGYLIDDVVQFERDQRPLQRAVLSFGVSWYALGPVLVLAAAGHAEFAWSHWPIYVLALLAQMGIDALTTLVRVRLHYDERLPLRGVVGVPSAVDLALAMPALGVVAVAMDAPVAAALIAAALLAIARGFTSERNGRLMDRERAAENARRAVFDERVRIARELHDVVAHHVSLMGVQAGAARVVLRREPLQAARALASIEASSRQAVLEMHRLLGFLRQAGEPEDLPPQPGLDQLDRLASAMSDSHLEVVVQAEGERRPLSPTMEVSAYRIVQEALTNTLKHAAASRADVHLRYHHDELDIAIIDNGRGEGAPSSAPGGHGLIGMRERVSLHGGVITTGPVPGGGFAVHATLPIAKAAA